MTTPASAQQLYRSGGQFAAAKSSSYRFLVSSVLTGKLMGDWLPIEAQSFSRVINGSGTLTGALDLIPASPQQNTSNLQAINPRKGILWVLQDGVPIWAGVIWDWLPQSAVGQQLQIQASTVDSILAKRVIEDDLVFTGTDIFDMARAICQYAFSKAPLGASGAAQVAGITYTQGACGITDSLTFDGSQNQYCSDAMTQLVNTYGIEWSFRPYADANGNLLINVDLGYPALGQPYPQSGLAYSFPGNLLDYQFTATGSSSANRVIATAQNTQAGGNGEALKGSAIDATDISNGYPLLEQVTSATGVTFTTDSQLDAYAAGVLPSVTATQLAPLVVLGNGQWPPLNVTQLGSYASCAFTSAMHPPGANGTPGFSGVGRVASWSCFPPNSQQAESVQVQMGAMPFEGSGAP